MASVSFIVSKDRLSQEAELLKQMLEHISSNMVIHQYKVPPLDGKNGNQWPAEMVADILESPFIVQGPLVENKSTLQQDVIRRAVNPHSSVCAIWGASIKLFLVSQPPIGDPVWSKDQHRFKCTMRTALELAQARGVQHSYEVGDVKKIDLWSDTGVKRIPLSEEEFIGRLVRDPTQVHIALVSPQLAQFIQSLAKTWTDTVTCRIDIGANHIFLPLGGKESNAEVIMICSLFCHYAGMDQSTQMLETFLDHNWSTVNNLREDMSGGVLDLVKQLPKSASSSTIHHLFPVWRDLSESPQAIVGFDIWILPSADPQQVGQALEEWTIPYPFQLVSIACKGIEIYPLRALPSLDIQEPWQCRFSLPKPSIVLGKEVSKLLGELSRIYPWVRVSLYRDWAETHPFLSFSQVG